MNSIELQVTKALNGLGTTSRGIADTLANKGVKGWRNCTDVCVLAVYLAEQFPGLNFQLPVSVAFVYDEPMGMELGCVVLDQSARDFIQAFDRGEFPELEAS